MPTLLAGFIVFLAAAAVLVLEILAGRLLAPYVGVTLETFTGIIGVVLAGIALGNWLGGQAADRLDPRRLLGPLLVLGGILALLSPTIVAITGPALSGGEPAEIVVLALLAFFAPAVVLSAVTPTVVKIRLRSLTETGSVVGRLSAVATSGALFGTFVTGFVLVAALPSRPIVWLVGITLIIAGVGLWLWMGTGGRTVAIALAVAASAVAASAAFPGPCQWETAYFCARIDTDEVRPSGRALVLDTLRHSYVDLNDPTHLEFRYTRIVADVLALGRRAPLEALYIGGGGFTLPRFVAATWPGSTATVLELDPTVVDIAERELGLTVTEDLTILTGDARLLIEAVPKNHFDAVVGDAFGGLSVPWHLTTTEFLTAVEQRLGDDGIYVMNLIDYPPHGFARAEAATLAAVFDHAAVVAPASYLAGEVGGNFVLVGSKAPLDAGALEAAIRRRGGIERVATGGKLETFVGDADLLSDDHAPVDQLLSRP